MAEYIERETAVSVLRHLLTPNKSPAQRELLRVAEIGVQRIPAADVAPVVRGRWDLLDDASSKIVKWNCDKCNRISTSKTDYCPNCGARMEG